MGVARREKISVVVFRFHWSLVNHMLMGGIAFVPDIKLLKDFL